MWEQMCYQIPWLNFDNSKIPDPDFFSKSSNPRFCYFCAYPSLLSKKIEIMHIQKNSDKDNDLSILLQCFQIEHDAFRLSTQKYENSSKPWFKSQNNSAHRIWQEKRKVCVLPWPCDDAKTVKRRLKSSRNDVIFLLHMLSLQTLKVDNTVWWNDVALQKWDLYRLLFS